MYLPTLAPGQTRIGVSIPIPPPWADEIEQSRISYGDAYAELVPPHITIIGPTAVNVSDLPAIIVLLDNICDSVPPFEVTLAGTGTFLPTSPVVFASVTEGIDNLTQLEEVANQGLLASERRFPYHPHVTLAQKVSNEMLEKASRDFAEFRARFRVGALWLYQQDVFGVWYKYLKFELRGRDGSNMENAFGIAEVPA